MNLPVEQPAKSALAPVVGPVEAGVAEVAGKEEPEGEAARRQRARELYAAHKLSAAALPAQVAWTELLQQPAQFEPVAAPVRQDGQSFAAGEQDCWP